MGGPGEEHSLAIELERVTDGFMAFDRDWRFTHLNSRAAALFQRPVDALVGRSVWELFPEAADASLREHGDRALREQAVQIYEEYVQSLDRWFEGRIHPSRDGISVFFNDITGRRRAEEAQRRAERRLDAILEHVPSLVFVKSGPDLRLSLVNAQYGRVTGDDPEKLIGRSDEELFGAEQARQTRAADEQVVRTGKPLMQELELAFGDGEPRTYLVVEFPLPREDGEIQVGGIATDVSERIEAERERAALEERLHRGQRLESLGRLVGGVAHDFNNMLAIILNHAELVCDRVEDRPAVHADAVQIRDAAERAAELVRRLLLFSRREKGHARAVDLEAVLAGAEPLLRRTLPESIELVLCPTDDECVVTADPGQLEQLLMNLVVNARDAMPAGGRLTVAAGCVDVDEAASTLLDGLPPGRYGALTVTDTGEGMAAEVLDRAFEPFFTTREGGIGLGLAVVYGIAREAGGHVALYAEPGRGTTARVRLPLAGRAADAPAAASAPDRVPPGGGELVMVAEDSKALRALTRRLLEDAGYRVIEAGSGAEALARGVEEQPDLLLTDVVMPGMSGRELAEALWERTPGLPVVVMSGYTDDVVLRHGLLGAGAAFLEKPFTRAQLLDAVHAALRG
jgi:two-component system, cell cycle sensor histidine kinase and response regulator CckA